MGSKHNISSGSKTQHQLLGQKPTPALGTKPNKTWEGKREGEREERKRVYTYSYSENMASFFFFALLAPGHRWLTSLGIRPVKNYHTGNFSSTFQQPSALIKSNTWSSCGTLFTEICICTDVAVSTLTLLYNWPTGPTGNHSSSAWLPPSSP